MGRPKKNILLEPLAPDLVCDDRVVHLEAVQQARQSLPQPDSLLHLSRLFAALGDPTRLRIVAALTGQELCVCDIAAALSNSESAISHQLRILRDLGLVRSRRDGRLVFYSLDDDHITTLYAQGLDHVHHRDA
jgi:ArsR family transcriptional regulator